MFLDAKIGLLLFITHFLASITVGLIFKNYMKSSKTSNIIPQVSIKSKTYENINLQNLGKHMGNAIQNSISTLFMILGYMVFFSVFSNILSNVGIKTFFCNIIKIFLNILNISFDLSNALTSLSACFDRQKINYAFLRNNVPLANSQRKDPA